MKIYVYGNPQIIRSDWVKRIKGVELNFIPDKKNIEKYPIVYVFDKKPPKELEEEFDLILNFNKNTVIAEKMVSG